MDAKSVHTALLVAALCCTMGGAARMSAQTVAVGTSSTSVTPLPAVSIDEEHATRERLLRMIAQQAGLRLYVPVDGAVLQQRLTLHVRDMQASEAFQIALKGTGLQASIVDQNVVLAKVGDAAELGQGSIIGKITDAATKRPVNGARVSLDDAAKGVTTSDDGTFRFSTVEPGTHVVNARRVGYVKSRKSITVKDGESASVDIELSPSVNALDQVVVTGTVVATELKAVPNAISIITAQEIEQRGITRIEQLFRGDVPGLFAQSVHTTSQYGEVTMFSRGATALSNSSAGTEYGTNAIKTYIDGVEMADSKYLSQIDPKSIERIEILTGPQASTIYGSNAINGVMQIFTKRGTSARPQLTLNLASGFVQNNFSNALTAQHEYGAQLSGVDGRVAYSGTGTWNYMAPWNSGQNQSRLSAEAASRMNFPTTVGAVTTDLSLRRATTQSNLRGDANPGYSIHAANGLYTPTSGVGRLPPVQYTLASQTVGLAVTYAPTHWWSHEFAIGQDVSNTEQRYLGAALRSVNDTLLRLLQSNQDRRSLRYTTTLRVPLGSFALATTTVGADGWQSLSQSTDLSTNKMTGPLKGQPYITRTPGHNAGGFLQTQFGLFDRLFFTYGLRAEWNVGFGDAAQPNYAPRYGVAYTQEYGPVTAKLRGSYGRSTRPPLAELKLAQPGYGPEYYGPYDGVLANPELGPEYQQGGEGGLELYFGTRGSLVVTRYNQTVDQLIASVAQVDSVDILPALRSYYGIGAWEYGWYTYQSQYLNIGSIRNQGWELQGTANLGPFTTRGTYSWTKSRTIGVNPKYSSRFSARSYPQYQKGATFQYLPEHTWAFGISYARAQTSVALNLTGNGSLWGNTNELYLTSLTSTIRLPSDKYRMDSGVKYFNIYPANWLADLNVTHHFSSLIEGVLQVQNVADAYNTDNNAEYGVLGRQTKFGLRVRF